MEYLRKVVRTNKEPDEKEVLWVDTAHPDYPVMKYYENGNWKLIRQREDGVAYIMPYGGIPYSDLSQEVKMAIASGGAQANWNQTNSASPDFIWNKPYIPTALADLTEDSNHKFVSATEKTSWSNKADRVQSAVAGHIATLNSSGNLVDSGKGISDINPLWGNIQGSIENQTDLMSALGNKYEKPSTGIPESDIAAGVVPKTLHITSWTPTYASGGNDINLGTRTQAAATLGITVTQLDAMMEREYDSVILSGTEDQVLSASAFSDDAVFYTANAVSSWYGLQFYIDEIEYHCIALQEELPTVPTDVVKYSQQLLTEAQKKQARINIGATSKEIFWATYGTTTASEISAAISAGKFVIVNGSSGQAYYWITTPGDIYFWGIAGVNVFYYIVNISDNSWLSNSKIIPEEQVNSDWNASSGKAQILNKPDLSTKAEKASTQAYSYGATAPSEPKEGDIWVSETLTEIPIPENASELTFTKTVSRYKLMLSGLANNDSAVFEWYRASDSKPFNSADYKPDGTYYFDAPDYEIEDNELYLSLTYTGDLWEVATLWEVTNTVYQYHNGSWVAMEVVTATEKAAWNAKYSKPSDGIPSTDLASGVIPDVSDFITKNVNDLTYYYTKTEVDGKVSSAYKAAGTAASVASLGTLDAAHEGFVYNMSASFTTTSDFVEGSGTTYPAGTNVAIVNTGTTSSPVYKYDVLAGFVDISGKADKSEMSVVDGTDANADKTTITLKSGTSATVLKSHQDISGKADKVSGATSGHLAALDSNGNLTDSGKSASDLTVEANPTVPSGTTPGTMEIIKIGSQYYELGGGTLDAEDYSGVAPVIVNPSNYYTKSETEAIVETPVASTQPSGGFLPNVIYDLGEITGSVTFALATPTDNTIANTYVWTFETGSTAPTIVWPSNLTWLGGNAPTINTGKHYEITVRKGYANCLEF